MGKVNIDGEEFDSDESQKLAEKYDLITVQGSGDDEGILINSQLIDEWNKIYGKSNPKTKDTILESLIDAIWNLVPHTISKSELASISGFIFALGFFQNYDELQEEYR
jgi:hypothetical protein